MIDLRELSPEDVRLRFEKEFPHAFEFLIDPIMPQREVHMLAGPSGAGKTTWLLDFLFTWQQGTSVFGYKSLPVPFMYIALDRGEEENIRTMARVRIHPGHIRIPSANEQKKSTETLEFYLRRLKTLHPEIKLFVIEGIQMQVPNKGENDNGEVARYIAALTNLCRDLNITIFGVGHTTKTKKDDHYESPRERIRGAANWGALCNLIIVIEPDDKSDINATTRNFFLMPRNQPERSFIYDWKDGLLVEVPKVPKTTSFSPEQRFFQFVTIKAKDNTAHTQFTSKEAQDFIKCGNDKWYDLLHKLEGDKVITKAAKGLYVILPYNPEVYNQKAGYGNA